MAPEVIDITKPRGDEAKIQLRHAKDQQLQGSMLSGETLPVVELSKLYSAEGGKDMLPSDTPESSILTFAPDKETKAAAESLEALQGQQWSLSTQPGEAE